jgi:hypothetical protein
VSAIVGNRPLAYQALLLQGQANDIRPCRVMLDALQYCAKQEF